MVSLEASVFFLSIWKPNRPRTPAGLRQDCAVYHGGSERLSLRLIWPTAKHRPIQHHGSGQSPLCTFGTIYCRFQSVTAGNLAWLHTRFAVRAARPAAMYCRMSTREGRCTCPPLHVTDLYLGSSCSRCNAFVQQGVVMRASLLLRDSTRNSPCRAHNKCPY